MVRRDPRTGAEWVTLAVSCAVLALVVGLIAVQFRGGRSDAAPRAEVVGQERTVGGQHFVTVEVENTGDATAANVQITADLVIDGETTSGDQTVDFLAGHETERMVFVFDDPPSDGALTVAVTGFAVP
ncbi:MAG: hypothetical protein JWO77_2577 [Ilumatobacteraceae bacterium]|nr:hypothetical protein [Ilumatobacteraceae bacterium]